MLCRGPTAHLEERRSSEEALRTHREQVQRLECREEEELLGTAGQEEEAQSAEAGLRTRAPLGEERGAEERSVRPSEVRQITVTQVGVAVAEVGWGRVRASAGEGTVAAGSEREALTGGEGARRTSAIACQHQCGFLNGSFYPECVFKVDVSANSDRSRALSTGRTLAHCLVKTRPYIPQFPGGSKKLSATDTYLKAVCTLCLRVC